MTEAHTPGPWEWVERNGEPHVRLRGSEDDVIYLHSEIGDYGMSCFEYMEISAADARSIAAAPEMLAALKGLEGILDTAESNASGNPEWEYVSKRVNAARAAILKATGDLK